MTILTISWKNGNHILKNNKMAKIHQIDSLSFEKEFLLISIDGQLFKINISDISAKLTNASQIERQKYEITPSGYGIHWPLIDEDLSVNGLLKSITPI
jgi:hypothetical protein